MTQSNTEKFTQRFTSLTVREQRMVVGTLLLVVWGSWDHFFYQPLLQDQQRLNTDIKQLEHLLGNQQAAANELEKSGGHDPNLQTSQSLSALQHSLNNLKQQLNIGEKRFVPSHLMASALRDMLKQHGNLQLLKLETLPPGSFGDDSQQTWVYRHSMNLTLQGDYFSTLNYLKALENLPWRIHWDSIDYNVKAYPQAETRIQVYTLSFEQDWLGV
jgi:MSHA biogenesis protein MshJ